MKALLLSTYRKPYLYLSVFLLLGFLSFVAAKNITLDADISALLPENFESGRTYLPRGVSISKDLFSCRVQKDRPFGTPAKGASLRLKKLLSKSRGHLLK